ncbi:MAG: hypothetical protein GX025_10355, partial [Clostridiales bacterium]|nr:hypothetical protein [Clostridiales bacterium]
MSWKVPKTNWKVGDVPAQTDFNRIEGNIDLLSSYNKGYAVENGTNNYSITLNPSPKSLYAGLRVSVKITNQNTSTSTLNINGLGAKVIKKANGNNVSGGNLKSNSIYTLIYNGVNFILQGEGGEGTAQPNQVLVGETFTNDNDTLIGTMPHNGARNGTITTQGGQLSIPAGYTTGGNIKAQFPNLTAGNIKEGVNVGGVMGTHFDIGVPNYNLTGNTITHSVTVGATIEDTNVGRTQHASVDTSGIYNISATVTPRTTHDNQTLRLV